MTVDLGHFYPDKNRDGTGQLVVGSSPLHFWHFAFAHLFQMMGTPSSMEGRREGRRSWTTFSCLLFCSSSVPLPYHYPSPYFHTTHTHFLTILYHTYYLYILPPQRQERISLLILLSRVSFLQSPVSSPPYCMHALFGSDISSKSILHDTHITCRHFNV